MKAQRPAKAAKRATPSSAARPSLAKASPKRVQSSPAAKASPAKRAPAKRVKSSPAAKASPKRAPAKPASTAKPKLLSGGNPSIAKADGDAPVQAYLAALPGWKREVGRRIDAVVMKAVPQARKAVKWNSPFYGSEGRGWFMSFHVFTHYVKVGFFRGASLRPPPPGASTSKETRYLDVYEGQLDEAQLAAWAVQAAALPGWLA
ncbi:MAG: DUF1801 domain-containing protein [Kofleriaceae bacterium]